MLDKSCITSKLLPTNVCMQDFRLSQRCCETQVFRDATLCCWASTSRCFRILVPPSSTSSIRLLDPERSGTTRPPIQRHIPEDFNLQAYSDEYLLVQYVILRHFGEHDFVRLATLQLSFVWQACQLEVEGQCKDIILLAEVPSGTSSRVSGT